MINDNKVSFEEGLKTLKAMFANYDEEVIMTVLEENDYKLEATIECLLHLQNNFENVPSTLQRPIGSNPGNVTSTIKPNSNNQTQKEEKELSLFENMDIKGNYNPSSEEIDPENVQQFENLQRFCIENNVDFNDIELMNYYMSHPELFQPNNQTKPSFQST